MKPKINEDRFSKLISELSILKCYNLNMKFINISIPEKEITAFCSQWDVEEFSLFGSVLSNEFNSESDIDVLISFSKDAEISLFDLAQMQIELQNIFNRPVDIIEKEALQNPYRKHQILETAQVIYESK